jgi:hypothetical protein
MTLRIKVIIGVVYTAACLALGAYLVPEKTKIVTKVAEAEKVVDRDDTKKEINRHKETKIVAVTETDGKKEVTTTITEDTGVNTEKKTNDTLSDNKLTTVDKEIVRGSSKVTISALFATNASSPNGISYGLSVTKPIFGPITVGLFGIANGTCGLSLGLTF